MADLNTQTPVEEPLTIIPDDPTPEAPAPIEDAPSIKDHGKQYHGDETPAAPAKEAKVEAPAKEPLAPIRPVDQQKRDEDGTFAPGKQRIKAGEAVKRINDLTARAKAAEERLETANREVARLKATGGTPTQIAKAEEKVDAAKDAAQGTAFADPEPTEDDPKFEGDYVKFLRAYAAWEARKVVHESRQQEQTARATAEKAHQHQESLRSWAGRLEKAKAKYADFETVAFGPTRIPADSIVDAFVMEDDNGPDVLYYLNQHPDEVDSLVRMPTMQALRRLVEIASTALSTPSPAGTTTAAPAKPPTVTTLPTPPTVVRTEAQRTGDELPPTDGSLSIAEHRKAFGPKHR